MTERYHYDKDGNYIGKTSDQPPPNGCAGILLIIFFAVIFLSKEKDKSPSDLSNSTSITSVNTVNSNSQYKKSTNQTKSWIHYNEYDMRMIATDESCDIAELVDKGYQFKLTAAILLKRLKNPNDAYYVDDRYATTVKGCWSSELHKAFYHRKHDGKEWEGEFEIDNTWTKIE